MKIEIIGKNIRVSNYLRDLVEKKLSKLDRYFAEDTEAHVKLTVEKTRHICEVSIPYVKGIYIRAKEVTGDMYASIDNVVDKLEKQVLHHRTKLEKRHRSAGHPPVPETSAVQNERELVRTKTFSVKPMSVEEASMQMELLDHAFFVFRNADNNEINVLYLRDDGDLGLIQPAAE